MSTTTTKKHSGGDGEPDIRQWVVSQPVLAVLVGVLLGEAVLRLVRALLDNVLRPALGGGAIAALRRLRGDTPEEETLIRDAVGTRALSRRARAYRVGVALVEFLALVAIAYLIARKGALIQRDHPLGAMGAFRPPVKSSSAPGTRRG